MRPRPLAAVSCRAQTHLGEAEVEAQPNPQAAVEKYLCICETCAI